MTLKDTPAGGIKGAISAFAQWLAPTHGISRVMHALTRSEIGWFKNAFIRIFIRLLKVDMGDSARPAPEGFVSFNDFFTRELVPGARPIAAQEDVLISPVDGTISAFGDITGQRMLQAKGRDFSLAQLLGGNDALCQRFVHGHFITIYLAPYNYHRIHMPLAGTLHTTRLIPGRLFSVNTLTSQSMDRLYARNERVVCAFDSQVGQMALVLVGALCVGSIETPWLGEITPGNGRAPREWSSEALAHPVAPLARGEEMGRFNMGSTVIALFQRDAVNFDAQLAPGQLVRLGEPVGQQTRGR